MICSVFSLSLFPLFFFFFSLFPPSFMCIFPIPECSMKLNLVIKENGEKEKA